MSNLKRVWDSKKRAVRQGKEQVWLVDGEKKVNTNHGFAEATGTDVVYDSSWEVAQEPLQTYENGWSEDVPSGSSVTINRELSQTTGEVGSQISIYLLCENAMTLSNPEPVLEFVELVYETGEGYNKIAKYRVVAQGTKTLTFTDNITGDSDSIEFTGTPAPITPVESANFTDSEPINIIESEKNPLEGEYSPVDASEPQSQIRLEPSDSSIIKMVEGSVGMGDGMIRGEVQGLSEGTATIDLYVNDNLVDQKTVIVDPFIHVQSISQGEATMSIAYGNTGSYTVPYTPNDATDPSQDISAETDDTTIATVLGISWKSSSIAVRGTGAGTTTLKYWLNTDPETVYQATVTVTGGPIQQISNIAQSISVENGTSTKVKLFDYLPTDANYDNVTVYNGNYYSISDFLLENGEYSVMINGTSEGTENLKFEFEGTEYQIPLTVTAQPSYEFTNSIDSSETDYTLLFGDNARNDYVNIAFTYDEQTGDVSGVNVYPTGEFNDSRYQIFIDTGTYNVWEFIFKHLTPEQMATLRTYQSFDSATWSALEDLYDNPNYTTFLAASDAVSAFIGGGA